MSAFIFCLRLNLLILLSDISVNMPKSMHSGQEPTLVELLQSKAIVFEAIVKNNSIISSSVGPAFASSFISFESVNIR